MKYKKGRSLIALTITIALFILLLRIGIERFIKFSILQNESSAQSVLKLISAALENFYKDNQNTFPSDLKVLSKTSPAYLDKDYIVPFNLKGYIFECSRMDQTGYNCSALPFKCRLSGEKKFTIATGGSLVSEDCRKD